MKTKKTYPKNEIIPPVTDDTRPSYLPPALRASETYRVSNRGLCSPIPPVLISVAEKGDWKLDRLEGGLWLVSQGAIRVGIFRETGKAVDFFIQRSQPELFR